MFTNSCDNDRFLRALESIASSLAAPQIVIGPPQQMTVDWDAGIKTTCARCKVEKPNDQFPAQSNCCQHCVDMAVANRESEGPPIEEVIRQMLVGERVLYHNRMRVVQYTCDAHHDMDAWASTIREVLNLMNPSAPKGSVLIERLEYLFDDIMSRQ
jgi:hypothetical protein